MLVRNVVTCDKQQNSLSPLRLETWTREEWLMLRYKHMRLDQEKIRKVKRILKAKTETEALDRSLERVILEDGETQRKKRIMKRMMDLRNSLGKMPETTADWVNQAREERLRSHDSGA